MPAQNSTVGGVLGAIFGTLGLSALAGLLVTVMVAPAIAVTGVTANSTIGIFDSLPEYLELNQGSQQNEIVGLDSKGKEVPIATIYYQNREEISLDEMSPYLIQAAIAGEDRRFEQHGGVDLPSVIRAAVGQVTNVDAGGASTLTMQTVRNVLIQEVVNNADLDVDAQNERIWEIIQPSFDRKLREMKYAIGLEKRYSKDEILAGYLNIAGFGGNTYGVQAAAQQYFSKDASELTIAEAASLLAIVQEPSARSLATTEDDEANARRYAANQTRRDFIIREMHAEGYITEEERDEALETPVDEDFVNYSPPSNGCLSAKVEYRFPCDYALRLVPQLEALGSTEQERRDNWRKGGYKLVLSIDTSLQRTATKEAERWAPRNERQLNLGAAVSSVEVGTGRILVMAQNKRFNNTLEGGGRGSTAVNYNSDVAGGGSLGFQPGSTYKPYVLLAFLDAGHGLNESFNAGKLEVPMAEFQDSCVGGAHGGAPYKFKNDAGERGNWTVQRGTAASVNSIFVQMAAKVDQCRIKELAESIGVHNGDGSELQTNPSCSIGGCVNNIAPLTQAAAYAAIANKGVYCEPVIVDTVYSPQGDELEGQPRECGQSLVTPDVANAAAYAMESVMAGTAAASNPRDGTPYFGKTGTTDASVHTWMIGSSSKVSTAVWVGNTKGKVALRNVYINGTQAAVLRHRIFLPIAVAIDKRYPGRAFSAPPQELITGSPVFVPSGLIGQLPENAKAQIELAELTYKREGSIDSDLPKGVIARVEPGEGSSVPRGTTVRVWVSNGEGAKLPDVVSDQQVYADAQAELAAAGFMNTVKLCVEATMGDDPETVDTDIVVKQSPSAGKVVNLSTQIELTVRQNDCS